MPTAPFSPALFSFLRELSAHNDRRWFQANRDRYERDVRGPMLRFVADLAPHFARVCPDYVADPRPSGGSLFRIHRDTRFSPDKRPYKTQASAHFGHRLGPKVHTPGFYLHLEPKNVFAAAGIWHPDPAALASIRRALVEDPSGWRRVVGAKAFKGACELEGETLSRAPRGFPPDHSLIADIRRKDFVATTAWTERDAVSPGFLDRFVGFCRTTRAFNDWLAAAVGLGA